MWAGGSAGSSNWLSKFGVRRTERWLELRSRTWPGERRALPTAAGSGRAPTDAAVLKSDGDRFRTAGPCRILNKTLVCHSFVKGKLIALTRFGRQGCLVALGVFQHVDAVMARNAPLPKRRCSVAHYPTGVFQVDANRQREAGTPLLGVPQ